MNGPAQRPYGCKCGGDHLSCQILSLLTPARFVAAETIERVPRAAQTRALPSRRAGRFDVAARHVGKGELP